MRKSLITGVVAGACAFGLLAVAAPTAFGAGGDNVGPAASDGISDKVQGTNKDRWAVVGADGALARGKGVVNVTHTAGGGSYIVEFNKNVRNCAYVATIGLPGSSGTSARGFITTVGAAVSENGVFITTDDTTGSAAERGFHLYVNCK